MDTIPWYSLCLGSVSKDFTKVNIKDILLNNTVYGLSVDHNAIKIEDLQNIHHYLMKRHNAK